MAKIMLVDDERATGDLLKMILELDGFEVTVCPTLAAARQQLHESMQAIILDRNLANDVNGTDLLLEIRAGSTVLPENTLVIMSSGDDRRESEAMEAGANRFFLKPFSPSELSQYISETLSS